MRVIAKEKTLPKRAEDRPTFIKAAYKRGYEIPMLGYQHGGIVTKSLWKSQDHVIRIIPGHDPATGEVFRQNINTNSYGCNEDGSINYAEYLSDTFCKVNIISGLGQLADGGNGRPTAGMTLVADYQPGTEWERQYGGNTVFAWFAKNIFDATSPTRKSRRFTPQPEWYNWTNFKGPLKLVRPALLMQCLAYRINGSLNATFDPDTRTETPLVGEDGDPLPVLATVAIDHTKSIDFLMQALVEPSNPAQPLDAITNNKYGGMAELNGNLLFLNSTPDPSSRDKGYSMLRPSVQEPGAGRGWKPTPSVMDAETAKALWIPWDSLLNYLTPQEQLKILAQTFDAETVNYVIGMDPQFHSLKIPDEIAKAGLGRYNQGDGNTQPQGVRISVPQGVRPAQPRPQPQEPPQQPPKMSAAVDMRSFESQLSALRKASSADRQDNAELAKDLLTEDIEEL